ncbi:MAG: tetratricopeptide repeat protein [Croceibacterium sp.]
MYRKTTHHGAGSRKGFAARAAIAVALAGGLTLGSAALSTPAAAKDNKQEAPKPEGNSKAFAEAYAPMMAIVNNPAGDFAAAKAMIPTVQASIQNASDKNVFGTALINLGGKLKDTQLETQGIQLVLDSGKADPSKVGLFQFFLGQAAYEAKNYADARTRFQAAIQAGYTQNDPRPAMAETYFGEGQAAQGLKYLSDVIKQEEAAGRKPASTWLLRGLQVAYQSKLAPQTTEYSDMLVRNYPSPQSWLDALQVVRVINPFDEQSQLDLLRLMRATGSLKDHTDYVEYVQAADPRRLAGEVLAVLDEGLKAGALTTNDPVYTEAKATATTRVAIDRKDAPALAADAKSAANGTTAQGAGDAFYSLGDYGQAAAMYQMAVDKGVKDKDMVLTRLGIAQINQGQLAQAKATLQKVGGARTTVATMWIAYIDTKSAPLSPPTPPTPPTPPRAG